MEHLEGEDLCERLQRSGRLGIAQAVDYVLQVCEGLAEAHAAGLVHRDLKPENLFVTHGPDRDELVKILDFGITKLPARIGGRSYTEPGSSVGSPHYMAPEQMNTPNDVDARADIWTLGVVLYESLAGRAPFEGDTIPAVCAQVLSARPVRLRTLRPDVPMALERAVMCCLENDRRARYADVFELARAIVAFGAPGAGLRMERIRRIVGSASPPVEVDRVSDIPVHLTRRRSVPAKPIKKSFGLYGAALASIGALGLATASTAQKMILPSFTLAPVAAVASRPLATPEFVPGPSGARTGALIAALPEVESETETARPSPPRPAPARRYTRASRRAAASKAPPPEATEPAAAKPKQPGPYDEPADGEAEPSATPTADSFRPPEP
jgi:serine/threonine-protein kinase